MGRTATDSEGHKWKGPLPKGWTDKSRKKFWESLTSGAPKHKVTECIKKMEGTDITNPGAFCAALADRVLGKKWRTEAAKERRKKKARQELHKAAASLAQPLRTRRDYGEEEDEDEQCGHSKLPGSDSLPMEEDPRVAAQWITRTEMETLCPPCAQRMKQAGITRVHRALLRRAALRRKAR